MSKKIIGAFSLALLVVGSYLFLIAGASTTEPVEPSYSSQEPGFDPEPQTTIDSIYTLGKNNRYTLAELRSWTRAEGPKRVGIQIGHLDNQSMPEELEGLEGNTGAIFGTVTERDVNQVVAQEIKTLLEAKGVTVDLLPATVPPGYEADAFISIHADGNNNRSVRGFKIAGPRRDYSGKSEALVSSLEEAYTREIPIPQDSNVTRRMTAYYAFNWPRYEHAIHPFTPAAIVEMGFLTNAIDRAVIVDQPELVARAIADGILSFLSQTPTPLDPPIPLQEPAQPLIGQLGCAPIRSERRGREDEQICVPSILSGETSYILDGIATSSFAIGTQASVSGVFRPVQVVDNYFWFPYEVAGFIENPIVEIL